MVPDRAIAIAISQFSLSSCAGAPAYAASQLRLAGQPIHSCRRNIFAPEALHGLSPHACFRITAVVTAAINSGKIEFRRAEREKRAMSTRLGSIIFSGNSGSAPLLILLREKSPHKQTDTRGQPAPPRRTTWKPGKRIRARGQTRAVDFDSQCQRASRRTRDPRRNEFCGFYTRLRQR